MAGGNSVAGNKPGNLLYNIWGRKFSSGGDRGGDSARPAVRRLERVTDLIPRSSPRYRLAALYAKLSERVDALPEDVQEQVKDLLVPTSTKKINEFQVIYFARKARYKLRKAEAKPENILHSARYRLSTYIDSLPNAMLRADLHKRLAPENAADLSRKAAEKIANEVELTLDLFLDEDGNPLKDEGPYILYKYADDLSEGMKDFPEEVQLDVRDKLNLRNVWGLSKSEAEARIETAERSLHEAGKVASNILFAGRKSIDRRWKVLPEDVRTRHLDEFQRCLKMLNPELGTLMSAKIAKEVVGKADDFLRSLEVQAKNVQEPVEKTPVDQLYEALSDFMKFEDIYSAVKKRDELIEELSKAKKEKNEENKVKCIKDLKSYSKFDAFKIQDLPRGSEEKARVIREAFNYLLDETSSPDVEREEFLKGDGARDVKQTVREFLVSTKWFYVNEDGKLLQAFGK